MVPIYCINRACDQDRKTRLEEIAQQQGLSIEFLDAVEGSRLDLTTAVEQGYLAQQRSRAFEHLSMNEIACFLSHRASLQVFLTSGKSHGVVIEDDVCLVDDFMAMVDALIHLVSSWDVVKLETRDPEPRGVAIGKLSTDLLVYATHKAGRGTSGMLYTREGAKKVLQSMNRFWLPVDNHLGGLWRRKVKIIGVFPSLLWEDRRWQSTIPDGTVLKAKGGILPRLVKRLHHLRDSAGKRRWAGKVARMIEIKP